MITKVDLGFFGTTNEKALKTKVTAWVKQNLVGKTILIKSKPLKVELSWQGLKNDINEYHTNYIEKLVSFAVLDKILKNAKYLYSEKDKKGRRDVKEVFRFFSRVRVGQFEYDVIIIIKETSKTFLYDHILIAKG